MKKEFEKRILSSLIIIPIVFFFITKGSLFFLFFLGIFFYATSYEWFKMNKNNDLRTIGIIYLFIVAYSAYYLRENFGSKIFIFVIIICIFTDIGGYIFGKLFKGPKLIKISPNKTISGSIGSFCFSLAPPLLFYIFDQSEYFYSFNNFLLCLQISLVCQLGDIFISYIKEYLENSNSEEQIKIDKMKSLIIKNIKDYSPLRLFKD